MCASGVAGNGPRDAWRSDGRTRVVVYVMTEAGDGVVGGSWYNDNAIGGAEVVRQDRWADSPGRTVSSPPPEHSPWRRLGWFRLCGERRPLCEGGDGDTRWSGQRCGLGSSCLASSGELGVTMALGRAWVATPALACFCRARQPNGRAGGCWSRTRGARARIQGRRAETVRTGEQRGLCRKVGGEGVVVEARSPAMGRPRHVVVENWDEREIVSSTQSDPRYCSSGVLGPLD